MSTNYVITHCHTMLSNGTTVADSIASYDDYIEAAKAAGMTSIAFTEHGNIFAWVDKKLHAEEAGLKYIHGEEFYVTENLGETVRDNYHCCLYAKNYAGVLELNRLSSIAFDPDHKYYAPRISLDELIGTSDNIIITTACLAGILSKGTDAAKDKFITFLTENRHRCFLEIQHHDIPEQIEYNRYLYALSQETGIPLIAGTDTHALNAEQAEGRKVLQKAKDVSFPGEEDLDLTFKSYDQLVEAYRIQGALPEEVYLEAIKNTNVLADMVESFALDRSYKYPHLWDDPEKTLRSKITDGLKNRGIDKSPDLPVYLDRIEQELDAYRHNQAIDFILLMDDVLSWCRTQGIYVGPGRGSVNGSVIAYLLGITEMDSIKHNLNFARFMNTERVSLADIDTDFAPEDIPRVKDYIYHRHGLYACDIITYNTIETKGAIRDVCRALYKNTYRPDDPKAYLRIADEICNGDPDEMGKKWPTVMRCAKLLSGTVVSIGTHPSGTLVADDPDLPGKLGLCRTATNAYPVCQVDMHQVDFLNFVKLDLLKLDTVALITKTCALAGIPRLIPDTMDIDDEAVWESIRDDTTGIFQWESSTAQEYIKKMLSDETIAKYRAVTPNVDRMTLLSVGNSAIRPAGDSYRDDLASGVVRSSGVPAIDDFLSPTYGYLVFQCQIINFLNQFCGFSMGEADVVRRGIAKKVGTEQYLPIIEYGGKLPGRDHEICGYVKHMEDTYGIAPEQSEKDIEAFLQVILDASSYLFSQNHATPYSYLGYACGWLRYYYPAEFLTVALEINRDKKDKTKKLLDYAAHHGIELARIEYGKSKGKYFCDSNEDIIYKGVGAIQGLNVTVGDELYEISKEDYDNFFHLLAAIKEHTSCNRGQLETLIKLDFFKTFGDPGELLTLLNVFDDFYGKKYISKSKLEKFQIDGSLIAGIVTRETKTRYEVADIMDFFDTIYEDIPFVMVSQTQLIKWQVELQGYCDTVIPDLSWRYVVVQELDTKYSPKFKATCLCSGKSGTLKVRKQPTGSNYGKYYSTAPFSDGDVLYIRAKETRKAFRGGEVVDDEYDIWITDYVIVDQL